MLFADGEAGAEIYSAAADKDQAKIVFDQAKAMVEESSSLRKRAGLFKNAITVTKTRSSYKVLSADAFTKHGLNAHGVIFDELHAQPNRELWDVLTTSMGARRQPLLVTITTAGHDRNSICWEQHEYARRLLSGEIRDDSYFAFIAAAGEDDDWMEPATWRKANPGFGATVKVDYLMEQCTRAQASPAYENTFRRLHLNQWTSQESRYIPMHEWDLCAMKLPDLQGRVCMAGLDLSTTTALTALVLAFEPVDEGEPIWLMPFFWLPGANLGERAREDKVPYPEWVKAGYITATPGNVVDYEAIKATLVQLKDRFQVEQVAYDPWNATQMAVDLAGLGVNMVEMRQGYASMSAPTKDLLRLILSRGVSHGGHPVLRWMADNLTVDSDAAGNVKPNKAKSRARIDGVVAAIMALDRLNRAERMGSIYDERDPIEL